VGWGWPEKRVARAHMARHISRHRREPPLLTLTLTAVVTDAPAVGVWMGGRLAVWAVWHTPIGATLSWSVPKRGNPEAPGSLMGK